MIYYFICYFIGALAGGVAGCLLTNAFGCRQAHWDLIEYQHGNDTTASPDDYMGFWRCSRCGCKQYKAKKRLADYCPDCGARMEKDDEQKSGKSDSKIR